MSKLSMAELRDSCLYDKPGMGTYQVTRSVTYPLDWRDRHLVHLVIIAVLITGQAITWGLLVKNRHDFKQRLLEAQKTVFFDELRDHMYNQLEETTHD